MGTGNLRKCVIIGGASIRRYDRIRSYLREGDFFVFCDGGLKHQTGLGVAPDLIVGDFDSYKNPELQVETIVLPRVKDDTDTWYAAKEALRRGFDSFLLVGVIGERLDHTLGNLSILQMLFNRQKQALLLDDYSEMEIVGKDEKFIEDRFPYFSVLNITGTAKEIEIRNAKFPLKDGKINTDYQFGISNEVLPGKQAGVRIGKGSALLNRVFPEEK